MSKITRNEEKTTDKPLLHLLGAAWGYGASDHGCAMGPQSLQAHSRLVGQPSLQAHWNATIGARSHAPNTHESVSAMIASLCQQLAKYTQQYYQQQQTFLTIGGDHTCAIGTWSGVFSAMQARGPLGLIWIDAHMDSHTPQTTLSGAIHGMPLACLLGYGDSRLTSVMTSVPKLQPQHVCLIGVRSFEAGEAALLRELKVRIFFMEEVKQRGLAAVIKEAHAIVTHGTQGYGISIDLDAIDPLQAPGVGSPAPDGLDAKELIAALQIIRHDPLRVGAEIAEFNPDHDVEERTAILIEKLANALF